MPQVHISSSLKGHVNEEGAPSDWEKADNISIVKKDNPGNEARLITGLGKEMEMQIAPNCQLLY